MLQCVAVASNIVTWRRSGPDRNRQARNTYIDGRRNPVSDTRESSTRTQNSEDGTKDSAVAAVAAVAAVHVGDLRDNRAA